MSTSACGSRDEPTAPESLFFPTVSRMGAYPAALLTGTLQQRSGCLFIGTGKERRLALWPDDYTARPCEDGIIEVLDDEGDVVGGVEDTITAAEQRRQTVGPSS